ncbi:MAG TPA: 1,4-alpha-glucan branching protein GlgB [Bacilli bacterium]
MIPSSHDVFLFNEGSLYHSYRMLGSHSGELDGQFGVRFTVWAPNAREVRVVGDFNSWHGGHHSMDRVENSGIWSLFVQGLHEGAIYQYEIHTYSGGMFLKADPYAVFSEVRPGRASVVHSLNKYHWRDEHWQKSKLETVSYKSPVLIYEVHLGTWKKKQGGELLTYREIANDLVDYVVSLGFTHIELLPLSEHPYDRSWGYQITGYYSVTSRFGTPEDFMYLVDRCHQHGIGVIMDWVPGHFCKDDHGLRRFDGMAQFEPEDERLAEKLEWGTLSFDFAKNEVISFLISNAIFWMEMYHVDGLRVDAVASMLLLNFGKSEDRWTYNSNGGNENLHALSFMKKLNEAVFQHYPAALMIAEDSTDWPLVSAPTYAGGLGFNYKWNMGWMNDILRYMEMDPIHRSNHHQLITFSFIYAFSENYILPFSHDEVVHGKKSLLNKMPGDYWSKFANLRVLYSYMMAHPGKKLLFMGCEFGQFDEWKDLEQLDWGLLEFDMHAKLKDYVRELNLLVKHEAALTELDHDRSGFEWIDPHAVSQSIVSFKRMSSQPQDLMIIICNFTPVVHRDYRVGVPLAETYNEIFNSDLSRYGGSDVRNLSSIEAEEIPWQNQPFSIHITIPPLGAVMFKVKSR